jgi:gliding motility-associated-like protein
LGGKQDGIVAKFNSSLSSLIYCSFIGGNSTDAGNSLVVKNNFEVYVTGGTTSQNFSTTVGAYQTTYQGGNADGYIMRIDPTGSVVLNSTYVGTSSYDQSFFVQLDKKGRVFIYGQSMGNMPVIPDPVAPNIFSVTNTHQFISRFSPDLSTRNLSTVFGNYTNNWDISPSAFSIDKCNHIYLSGWGTNFLINGLSLSNMPLMNPTQNTTDGNDFYFMALDSNAASILYGSYFGGNLSEEHVDGGTSRFDPQGRIYQSVCAGCGGNDDFPVTPGAWPGTPGNPNHATNCNNGVIKLDFQLPLAVSTINSNTVTGCVPLTVSFTNATPGTSFIWYFGNGQTNTVSLNPVVTYTNAGTYTVSLVVFTPTACNVKDSSITFITVLPLPTTAFNATTSPCSNSVSFVNNSSGTLSPNPYIWTLGDGSPSQTITTPPPYTYSATGIYTITLVTTAANGCTTAATQTVSIFNFTPAVNQATICEGDNANLTAAGGTSYTWSPATGLGNVNAANPAANPTVTTIYSVQVDNNTPGYVCSKTLTTQVTVNPRPHAAFFYTVNPCGGGVNFFDNTTPTVSAWNWTLAPTITSTVQNPYNWYPNGGTFTVSLSVSSAFGCKDSTKQVLTVGVPPPLAVSGGTIICLGNSVKLFASGGTSYTWTPPQTLDTQFGSTPIASPTVSTQYSVNIGLMNGCNFLLTTDVGVSYPSTVQATAIANPTYVTSGNTVTLVYTGSSGANVGWLPVGSTTPATGYTVVATPKRPTTYTAVASYGACKENATVTIDAYSEGCLDGDVFIPNTFTPNGDGQNDVLFVRGLKVSEVYFAVYNRWGEAVFETKDKTVGWDGVYKGRPADVGVFGWYLKVKCLNGEETFKKGNVTLIR